jgi:hypothetical protein
MKDHERFLRSIATSRSLPHIQSSVAGASTQTWKTIREVQAKARSRNEAIELSAEEAAAVEAVKVDLDSRASALDAAAQKRKAQRDKKKKAKKGSSSGKDEKGATNAEEGEEGSDSAEDKGVDGN